MKIRSQLLLSNALIVGLFIVVVATSFLNMRTLISSADWVAHTSPFKVGRFLARSGHFTSSGKP